MAKVLVVVPNDFRDEARARFAEAQWRDAELFAQKIRDLGHEAILVRVDLIEPTQAYTVVKKAIEEHKPTHIIMRCYLWADPPNGHAVILATPSDIPLGISGYIPPEGAPLGEAPGEVFVFHISCVARMTGRDHSRLWGPLDGPGSDQTMNDLGEFLTHGKVVSDVDFPNYPLPITSGHTKTAKGILAKLRGKIVAMTGQPSMGMLPCTINTPWHCGAGSDGGWGLNIPIMSPDLYYWVSVRFKQEKKRFMQLGRLYVQWLQKQGVRFCFQYDFDGTPLSLEDRQAYTPEVAAYQMALYACMVEITEEMNISILGIPSQLVMTDFVTCGDLIKGVACSSQGPEGRTGKTRRWSTEGDIDGAISEEILEEVTKHNPIFCDVRCFIAWLNAWMLCNSGQGCKDMALGGWMGCYSAPQYGGYFRAKRRGGTLAFANPRVGDVLGLRVAIDHQGPYGTIALGRNVQSDNPRAIVDGRWPQYKAEIFATEREARIKIPTNHIHFAITDNPIEDACIAFEIIRLAAGGDPSRVQVLYDGRKI